MPPTMPRSDEPILPMTLGKMRNHGVRGLFVTCSPRGHITGVDVDAWLGDVPVPSFDPHMRCTGLAISGPRRDQIGSSGGLLARREAAAVMDMGGIRQAL